MKAMFFAIAMLAASASYAFGNAELNECVPYLRYGPTDDANYEMVYPCGINYTVKHFSCQDGEVAYFPIGSSNGALGEYPRTCVNGSFFPKQAPVAHKGCKEGQVAYTTVTDASNGEATQYPIVCKNGKFRRMH